MRKRVAALGLAVGLLGFGGCFRVDDDGQVVGPNGGELFPQGGVGMVDATVDGVALDAMMPDVLVVPVLDGGPDATADMDTGAPPPPDAGAPFDAAVPPPDAGPPPPDAGGPPPPDAGSPPPDAGSPPPPDAGPPPPDSGSPTVDASPPTDAATLPPPMDAEAPDAFVAPAPTAPPPAPTTSPVTTMPAPATKAPGSATPSPPASIGLGALPPIAPPAEDECDASGGPHPVGTSALLAGALAALFAARRRRRAS